MIAPVVTISVYSTEFGLSRRRKNRQCRSVQSIIGATANKLCCNFIWLCNYINVLNRNGSTIVCTHLRPFLPYFDLLVHTERTRGHAN
jgi:hypothetical protein